MDKYIQFVLISSLIIMNIASMMFICHGLQYIFIVQKLGQNIKIVYYIKIGYIIVCTSLALSLIFGISFMYHYYLNDINGMLLHLYLSCGMYIFGTIHVYLLLLLRVQVLFGNATKIIGYILFGLLLLTYIMVLIFLYKKRIIMCISFLISLFVLHIISSIMLPLRHLNMAIKLLRGSGNSKKYLLYIQIGIKYFSIIFITTITSSITCTFHVMGIIYIHKHSKPNIDANILLIVGSVCWIDSFINIVLLHLQFAYLSKYYSRCCDTFRHGINSLFNRHIKELSNELTTETIDSSIYDEFSTSTYSPVLTGAEPTKTGDAPVIEEPSTSFPDNGPNMYTCNGCPLFQCPLWRCSTAF
mmetsp:Transcript_85011/g.104230  ORF Transcript_85011/g.104230 Transcript_85011/m.104230 type:complete len:357 (+) Transcript_85011:67-1137(+)